MSIRKLSPELQAKASAELNEVPERIQEDLQYIKEWLKKQVHIKARTDDQWLISFLRGCKFSLERTKEKLDMFYTMRTIIPEFFSDRDPFKPEIQEILKLGLCLPLPKTIESDSPRILLLRNGLYDPKKVSIVNIFKSNMMIADILLLEDDNFLISGERVLQDMDKVTMAHMATPPSIIKKAMTCFQESYPVRIKGLHFFNIPSFFEMIYNLFRPFMKEKMTKRVNIYTSDDMAKMYADIPRNILPKEYGGDGPSVVELTAQWKKKVESYAGWFKEDAQYCTNEKLRPGKPKTVDNVFGLEGSFRKLAVD